MTTAGSPARNREKGKTGRKMIVWSSPKKTENQRKDWTNRSETRKRTQCSTPVKDLTAWQKLKDKRWKGKEKEDTG